MQPSVLYALFVRSYTASHLLTIDQQSWGENEATMHQRRNDRDEWVKEINLLALIERSLNYFETKWSGIKILASAWEDESLETLANNTICEKSLVMIVF